jgi:hypothetical protein
MSAVSRYGATTLMVKTCGPPLTPGVVDYRIHLSETVHLIGDTACLVQVGQVADDDPGAAVQQVVHGREPIPVASVDDDLVPLVEERLRGRPSEAVRGAGDEDACH